MDVSKMSRMLGGFFFDKKAGKKQATNRKDIEKIWF